MQEKLQQKSLQYAKKPVVLVYGHAANEKDP
jgi:hypothetical protein